MKLESEQEQSAIPTIAVVAFLALYLGEFALFALWFIGFPSSLIRLLGIALGMIVAGLIISRPQLIATERYPLTTAEIRGSVIFPLAIVVFLGLGTRMSWHIAIGILLVIGAGLWLIALVIHHRKLSRSQFVAHVVSALMAIGQGIFAINLPDMDTLVEILFAFMGGAVTVTL